MNKVGQMRRQLILPRHVIWPFVLFVLTSLAMLIAWTISDPTKFCRLEVHVDGFVDPISVPTCTYEVGFQTALQVPLLLSMAVVLFMSYKTRDLEEDITDSRRVAKVLISHVLISLCKSSLKTRGLSAVSNGTVLYFSQSFSHI
jgi:hypothetical protein